VASLRLVISESLVLCLIGGLLGTLTALSILYFGGMAIDAEGVTIAFRPSFEFAILGLELSLAVGMIAGLVPATQAAGMKIRQNLSS